MLYLKCVYEVYSVSKKTVTAQAGAEWFPSTPDQKPRDIALAAIDYARKHFFDVLLVDTAGRLAIDEALMAEIKELHAILNSG